MTGHTSYKNLIDCLEVLELDLSDEELQYLLFIIYQDSKDAQHLYYPGILKWINNMSEKHTVEAAKPEQNYEV